MDLQARLVKAGKRKKKKGDMGAGKKEGNRDGEGYSILLSQEFECLNKCNLRF
jgi:hypothetical protein